MIGHVYLVGAGPWDPGLLTLRGAALLGRADVVIYDYLANPDHLAHCRADCERIPVRGSGARMSQADINDLLVAKARAGHVVVRLKGGDPFVFGRGGEEAERLVSEGIPFEVVPGVTAAIAGSAFAGIPVTHRGFGSTLAFVTGHEAPDKAESDVDWGALAKLATLVFYMGARNLGRIADALMAAGRAADTPVAVVRWATRPDQKTMVTTLGACAADLEASGLKPPLTIIVGEVVGLREQIGWYETKPLHGLSVVVTRSQGQQGWLAGRLAELGAEVVPLPTIAFAEPSDAAPLERASAAVGGYDWVVFTSANAVDAFLGALRASGRDLRAFGRARIACVGPATARRARDAGIEPDLVPESYVAEGLVEALLGAAGEGGLGGRRVLFPRAEVGREVLPSALRAAGATVDLVAAYRTVPAEPDPEVRVRVAAGDVDVLTFTAGSTVKQFCALFDDAELARLQARAKVACIGPVAAETAREHGFDVVAVPSAYTVPDMVDALVEWRSLSRDAE